MSEKSSSLDMDSASSSPSSGSDMDAPIAPTLGDLPVELKLVLLPYLYSDPKSVVNLSQTSKSFLILVSKTAGIISSLAKQKYGIDDLEKMPFIAEPRNKEDSWTAYSYLKRILIPYGNLLGLWQGDVPAFDGRFLSVSIDPLTGNIVGFDREPAVPESIGPLGQPGNMPVTRVFSIDGSIHADVLLDSINFTREVARRGGVLFSITATLLGVPIRGKAIVDCHGVRPGTRHARALGIGAGSTLHPTRILWGARGWSAAQADMTFDPARVLSRLLGVPHDDQAEGTASLPDDPFGDADSSGLHPPPPASSLPERMAFTANTNTFLPYRTDTTGTSSAEMFTIGCAAHSPLPAVAISPAGSVKRVTYSARFSRLKLPPQDSCLPFKEGIWLGTYGGHGIEYLLCRPSADGEEIEFAKVTGDSNVPRGAVSLKISKLSTGSGRRVKHFETHLDLSRSTEYGECFPLQHGEGFEPILFSGRATVALTGFSNPSSIDASVIVLNEQGTDVAVVWHELENVGRMRYVG